MANDTLNRDDSTGEVEILEFVLGEQTFGVSVLKIEAIEQYDPGKVTTIPMSPPTVAGTWLSRGRTLPMLDLGVKLNVESSRSNRGDDDSETASEYHGRAGPDGNTEHPYREKGEIAWYVLRDLIDHFSDYRGDQLPERDKEAWQNWFEAHGRELAIFGREGSLLSR